MDTIAPAPSSFNAFINLLTGYRPAMLLITAHQAGCFQYLSKNKATADEICTNIGWDFDSGGRGLRALHEAGLLHQENGVYSLSAFSEKFLSPESPSYQGNTLDFEQGLLTSWQNLGETLTVGRRTHDTQEKTEKELQAAYAQYLGAMDEAAATRAVELWDHLTPEPHGTILDIGAGSGRFLAEFLNRNLGWQGIFSDLPVVVANAARSEVLFPVNERIRFHPCNYLEPHQSSMKEISSQSCQIVLLSNVVHCQGKEETSILFFNAMEKTARNGLLIVHDFFTDTPQIGPLYDIHMLINTYNGRTYNEQELSAIASSQGFKISQRFPLPSGSECIFFAPKNGQVK